MNSSENNKENEKRDTKDAHNRREREKVKSYDDDSENENHDCDEDELVLRQLAKDDIRACANVTDVCSDGNCLFRCIAVALFGDEAKHDEVRTSVVNFMRDNRDFCRPFIHEVDEDYDEHVRNMSIDKTWGTDAEIFITGKLYGLDVFVHKKSDKGWEWLRYDPDLGQCNHSKKFIAVDLRNEHFRHVRLRKRPCVCERDIPYDFVSLSQQEDTSGAKYAKSPKRMEKGTKETQHENGKKVKGVYEKIAFWKQKNLFDPPKCEETKEMIREMTRWILEFVENKPNAEDALKWLMILPTILLQKQQRHAKLRDNIKCLKRRVKLLKEKDLDKLFKEALTLRTRHERSIGVNSRADDEALQFRKLMQKGRVNPSLRLLSKNEPKGLVELNKQTREDLKSLHPRAEKASPETKLQEDPRPAAAYLFESIDGETIWKTAIRTDGSAGPSGLNAKHLKSLLSKKLHGEAAVELREAIAKLARKLATEQCEYIEALTARRLIPLDKDPGVRPIGVGEVIMRVIGKCIMKVLKEDIKEAAGSLQLCAGHRAGGEAAIHAMREIYEEDGTEAVILVDATNAFNSIDREAMLHNIKVKCPTLSVYVENTYGTPTELFIEGGDGGKEDTLLSEEGTTQGDPIAMAMYSIGMSVLQSELAYKQTNVKSAAYADDYFGAGNIRDLRQWWGKLETIGPKYGYKTNASKTWLIVKEEKEKDARELFRDTNIEITTEGQRHLGAVIGSQQFKQTYVQKKVQEWSEEVDKLSEFAKTEPHAAYTAFTYGLKHRWTYLTRTVPGISDLMKPLEDRIRQNLIPALTNQKQHSDVERNLLALPPRMGGLGIINPTKISDSEYDNSVKLTKELKLHIINQDVNGKTDEKEIQRIGYDIAKSREQRQEQELNNILPCLDKRTKIKIEMAKETGASNWLSSLPIKAKGFQLNKQEFKDALAMRYGWEIEGLPDICPCDKDFTQEHAMVCPKGGFISMRHDEVRDLTYEMLKEVCKYVTKEPALQPMSGETFKYKTAKTQESARVDLMAQGFWTRGQRAFFDVRIFEPTAQCYVNRSLDQAHRTNEQEKKRGYAERIRRVEHGTFTPLVFSTSGGMATEAQIFYKRLAQLIAEKKQEPRSYVTAYLRTRLSFALVRSAILCLRGSRPSYPNTSVEKVDWEADAIESRLERLE